MSSSQSQSEIRNKLPYNRWQVNQQFKIPPAEYQKVYPQEDCYQFLKDQFDEIQQYGYDFSYTQEYDWAEKVDRNNPILKHRALRRKVKLRFRCDKCPNKQWTSIVGTMEMKFNFECKPQLEEDRQFPYVLKFNLRIYRMKCINCMEYGTPLIYQSQLITFARSVCITLTDILEEVPAPQYKDKRHKMKEQIHNHIVDHCEACLQKRCFAKPKY